MCCTQTLCWQLVLQTGSDVKSSSESTQSDTEFSLLHTIINSKHTFRHNTLHHNEGMDAAHHRYKPQTISEKISGQKRNIWAVCSPHILSHAKTKDYFISSVYLPATSTKWLIVWSVKRRTCLTVLLAIRASKLLISINNCDPSQWSLKYDYNISDRSM